MDIPDVSGYRLDRAKKLLEAQGIERIEVRQTAPPRLRDAGYDGSARVVRQTLTDSGAVVLLVCKMHI